MKAQFSLSIFHLLDNTFMVHSYSLNKQCINSVTLNKDIYFLIIFHFEKYGRNSNLISYDAFYFFCGCSPKKD